MLRATLLKTDLRPLGLGAGHSGNRKEIERALAACGDEGELQDVP